MRVRTLARFAPALLVLLGSVASAREQKAPRPPAQPPAQTEDAAPAAEGAAPGNPARCLKPGEVPDADGDFSRNAAALSAGELCITVDQFVENGRKWSLQVITNTAMKGPLWAVPHDNENAAFNTAVWAVRRYGGTVVAVESGGGRFFRGVDPNRNFGAAACGRAPSPRFTGAFLNRRNAGHPVIALHTNDRGSARTGGSGHISVLSPPRGSTGFRGKGSTGRLASEDTLIFVASTQGASDPYAARAIAYFTGRGINVIAERVSGRFQDCSMSNYAATHGIRNYFNAEVVHGDSTTQRLLVEAIIQFAGGR